jgi:uncharacterized protein YndB with AHSA1/START domain
MTRTESNRLVVTTPSDLEVVMTREFDAPRELVFDAWTKPEHLRRWFGGEAGEMIVCEVDLRPGGRYRFVWRLNEGGEMGFGGEYQEVVRPERFVATEVFEGDWEEVMGGGTLNTTTFEERDGRTLMTMTSLYKTREARDSAIETGMEDGANESMDRLAALLATLG